MNKAIKYTLREGRDLVVFFLLPALSVVLPWSWYYALMQRVLRLHVFFHRVAVRAWDNAVAHIEPDLPQSEWVFQYKLLIMLDVTDYWLLRFRKRRALQLIEHENAGFSTAQRGQLALSMHWGTGLLALYAMKQAGLQPQFVYAEYNPGFAHQGFLERRYRRMRTRLFDWLSGTQAITTGGGFARIRAGVAAGCTPVILFDAPKAGETEYCLQQGDLSMAVASGVFTLLCDQNLDGFLFDMDFDVHTGRRPLRVGATLPKADPQALQEALQAVFFERVLQHSARWYFWSTGIRLLREDSTDEET